MKEDLDLDTKAEFKSLAATLHQFQLNFCCFPFFVFCQAGSEVARPMNWADSAPALNQIVS